MSCTECRVTGKNWSRHDSISDVSMEKTLSSETHWLIQLAAIITRFYGQFISFKYLM